jgi:dsDNA-binding SOS-regulon protein
MYENFAKYSFNDTQLKAVETIETMKEALTADKYDTVVELADDYIEALEAIAPVLDDETVKYPWTAALNALNAKKTEAVTAINLAKAKIDAKEVVMAYAEEKLYGVEDADGNVITAPMFTGDEKNFNDIEAFIKAAAKATDADIDAVTDIANIDAAILAAKGEVDVEVYNQMLNLAKAAVQTTVMGIAKDAKNYDVDYTAIGVLANTTVINAYAVVITVDTNNSTETTLDDTLAGAYSIALAAVNKCETDFKDADIVKAYLDLVRV